MDKNEITITASAKYNAVFFQLMAFTLACLAFVLYSIGFLTKLTSVFVTLICLVLLIISILKQLEPKNSFILTPEKISYHHKYGQWFCYWQDIQRIDKITIQHGLNHIELPYVGIRLKEKVELETNIAARLASRLLHEQRDLYIHYLSSSNNLNEDFINFSPYKTRSGKIILGPIAAWLYRRDTLRAHYGYDFYIPYNAVNDSAENFISLLKNCKAASIHY